MKQPLRAILSFGPVYPTTLFVAIGRDGGAARSQLPMLRAAAERVSDALLAPLSASLHARDASVELRIYNHAARTDFAWGIGDIEREGPSIAGVCAALEGAGIEHRGTLALADWAVRRYLHEAPRALLNRSDHAVAVAAIQDLRSPLISYLHPGSAAEARNWDFLTTFHTNLDPLSVALVSQLVRGLRTRIGPVRTSRLFGDERTSLSNAELLPALDDLQARGLISAYRHSGSPFGPNELWEFELEPGPALDGLLAKDLLTPPRPFGLSPLRQVALDPASGLRHLCATNVGRFEWAGCLLASASPVTICVQAPAAGWLLSAKAVDCATCLARA